jgi:hypothetical protein
MDERALERRPEPQLDGDEPDAATLARRAQWARLLEEAQRLFEAAPRYRIQFETDGTVSLREKAFAPSLSAPPAAATIWRILSGHPTLEEAERRLRHVTSPPVYYDERGQLARPPATERDGGAR